MSKSRESGKHIPEAPDYPDEEGRRQDLQESGQHLDAERPAGRVQLLEPEAEVEEGGGEGAGPGDEVED